MRSDDNDTYTHTYTPIAGEERSSFKEATQKLTRTSKSSHTMCYQRKILSIKAIENPKYAI